MASPQDLQNAQFGQYGYVILDNAAGEVAGPFDAIVPISGSGVTFSVLEVDGVSTADLTKDKAVTGQTGTVLGRITAAHVSSGAARAYKAKGWTPAT